MTQRELLVRIDERQQRILRDLTDLKKNLLGKVSDDDEYKGIVSKVNVLWDDRNKAIGYLFGYGAAGGAIVTLAAKALEMFS